MYRSLRIRTAKVAVTADQQDDAGKDGRDAIWTGRPASTAWDAAARVLVRTRIALASVHLAGAVAGAPFCFTKKTRNFAGLVVLALRETV